MKEPTFYATPEAMPESARATYKAAEKLNEKLLAVLRGASLEVGVNAVVNLLIAQAVNGDKQTRDDMRTVLTHAAEYINRLDMQAPVGTVVN
jgi:hypothetical protein